MRARLAAALGAAAMVATLGGTGTASAAPLEQDADRIKGRVDALGEVTGVRCTDFDFYEDANFWFNLNDPVADPDGLDDDRDGEACEYLPAYGTDFTFSPEGNLDFAFGQAGGIHVGGWTLDPDRYFRALDVHVYVDGRAAGAVRANGYRPDVQNAFTLGSFYGFDATVAAGPGNHRVCVYAIDKPGYDPNATLGCSTVTVPAAAPQYSPVGAVDPLQFFPDGRPVVRGWAADPEAISASLDVHLYVDGRFAGMVGTGNEARPDVLAVTGAPNAGYVAILPAQGGGRHNVCAYGINAGPTGHNELLGCRTYG